MHYDVVQVDPIGTSSLAVRFVDGASGVVELRETFFFGVFEALRNPAFFSQVRCDRGFVEWPGELDLAPDAMYEAIRLNGRCVLE